MEKAYITEENIDQRLEEGYEMLNDNDTENDPLDQALIDGDEKSLGEQGFSVRYRPR